VGGVTWRSTTRPPRPASGRRRPDLGERPQGGAGQVDAAYIGEFNSGASAISIPILNEAGVPQISPGEHGRRPDDQRAGRHAGRAGQVLPDRQAHLRAHRPEGHDPGRRARHADEAGRLHQGRHDQRQGGLRRRASPRTSSSRPRRRASRSSATTAIDKKAPNYRSLASEGQGAPAPTASSRRHHRQQRGPALQGLRAALPNAKLYGPDGVCESGFVRPEEGAASRPTLDKPRQVHGRDADPGQVPAGGPGVLQGLQAEVRRGQPGPVRDLRLRGDEASASTRSSARRQGQRQGRRHQGAVRDQGPQSVLGTYSIDKNGDTTLTDYGVYKVKTAS
jgi:branched-chain amino acid transport system substrate-binding protein